MVKRKMAERSSMAFEAARDAPAAPTTSTVDDDITVAALRVAADRASSDLMTSFLENRPANTTATYVPKQDEWRVSERWRCFFFY